MVGRVQVGLGCGSLHRRRRHRNRGGIVTDGAECLGVLISMRLVLLTATCLLMTDLARPADGEEVRLLRHGGGDGTQSEWSVHLEVA